MIKRYTVYFHQTAVGEDGGPITAKLREAHAMHGPNLPEFPLNGHGYQVRDLRLVGHVWSGVFAQLRDDAPHVVSERGRERPLDLNDGDRLVEKCHFLFFESRNIVVWQSVRGLGGTSTLENYLSWSLDSVVTVNQVQNLAELERVLQGQVYELQFSYARPNDLGADAPQWNHHAFSMMESSHAAKAKFMLRAPRHGALSGATRNWIRRMVNGGGFEKVRVKLTEETNMVDLFMAPLKDSVEVELFGRYPNPTLVFAALNQAYDRQRDSLPAGPNP